MEKETKKKAIFLRWMPACICGILLIAACIHICLIRLEMYSVKSISLNPENAEEGSVHFDVETCEITDGILRIAGWRAVPTNERREFSSYFILSDEEGNAYQLPTSYVERPDVTDLVQDGNSYTRSGMICEVKTKKLKSGRYMLSIIYRPDSQTYVDFPVSDYFVIPTDTEVEIP